jgi:polyhydroxyalkanoate synthesis repressor PhaR
VAAKSKTRGAAENNDGAVVVKKYANRRLYNTATSSYVTLDDLSTMVRDGVDFVVYDAKSGDDITRSVLTQIIFEQESRGQNLLPIAFLRRLIRFYGDSMQAFVPSYLEASMEAFAAQQDQLRQRFESAMGGQTPLGMGAFEEQARKNMALFEQTMRMFSPFSGSANGDGEGAAAESATVEDADEETLDELRRQMSAMQKRLDALSKKSD